MCDIMRPDQSHDDTRDPIFLLQRMIMVWHTESIWFTREEAEAYIKAHRYDGPYRVYSVMAKGELARLLDAHTEAADG